MNRTSSAFFTLVALAGCTSNDPRTLDRGSTPQAIATQTDSLADSIANAAGFLGQTDTAKSTQSSCTGSSPCTTTVDTAQPFRDAAKWLKDNLFNDARVDADHSTTTAIVYCVKPSDVCKTDAKCLKTLEAVPVCVKVQSFEADQYDLDVLIGKDQALNPFRLHLQSDLVSIEYRLADIKKSYESFATAAGEALPEAFPSKMEGSLSWTLRKMAAHAVQMQAAVTSDVTLDVYTPSDSRFFEVRVGQAAELETLLIDDDARKVTAHIGAKSLDVVVAAQKILGKPASPCPVGSPSCTSAPARNVTGQLLAHLDGASYDFVFDASRPKESLTFSKIGLGNGTSRVQYSNNGSTSDLLKIDLNASMGRTFDVTVTKQGDDALLTLSPGFDAVLDLDLSSLVSQIPDISGAGRRSITEVALTGTGASVLVRKATDDLKVVAGNLELKATGMTDGESNIDLMAPAGMCVVDNSAHVTVASDAHPFAKLAATSCP